MRLSISTHALEGIGGRFARVDDVGFRRKTMRVLHVIPSMAAEVGGPPAVCAGLAGALAARGHAVTVAALETRGFTPVAANAAVAMKLFQAENARGPTGGYGKSRAFDAWVTEAVGSFDIVH